ncbi:hypothetical protein ACTMTI_09610 [Nonomuraea sp. H19]|uniref:hypothetical protein n=1 Tax=Nonomuraea sp. H19 TaxID=3452206 RepID=UPI003F8A8035
MKRGVMVVLLVVGVAAAGVMSMGLVRAADRGPDLGGPVVVSPSPVQEKSGSPVQGSPEPAPSVNDEVGQSAGEPAPENTARPTPRKTKAEPVKPPSPRPGGDGNDDDDDDGDGDDD